MQIPTQRSSRCRSSPVHSLHRPYHDLLMQETGAVGVGTPRVEDGGGVGVGGPSPGEAVLSLQPNQPREAQGVLVLVLKDRVPVSLGVVAGGSSVVS